ncbi:MAG: ketoacyl-ACP synthase III [Proteobacteria bacterium]|nr:ketoacyl-ACP synthase III [Pseudomonadota bacterium]
MATTQIIITGIGGYLPANRLGNNDLPASLETSDEWIVERTGISYRHIADKGEYTSDLAAKALRNALDDANLSATDLDGIIIATTTPDLVLPSTAAIVQQKIGASNCMALDLNAVCSGFIYAFVTASQILASSQAKRIAVVGADTMSRILDWQDRSTCVLFGDGGGAVILENKPAPANHQPAGILAWTLRSDGNLCHILETEGGTSHQGQRLLKMQGREVFRHGVEKMCDALVETMEKAGVTSANIDYIIPHQANVRMINAITERLGIEKEKAIITVDKHANTASASIPLALNWAKQQRLLRSGQIIAMPAAGAGFTWGNILLRV